MRKLILVALTALVLSACKTTEEAMREDPGPKPSNYQETVRNHLTSNLKDPDSLKQFAMTNLYKGSLWRGAIGGGALPVWVTCVTYNAKNSYGGYTGAKTIAYAFDRTGMFWVLDTADLRQGFHYTHCPRE